jgi:hypothetical protein
MVLILESRSHLDLGDLPNMLAAELGLMTVRLERAIRSLDDVARVHVNRWGDGSAHLHLWFLARPYGRLQLRGTFLSLWDDILPAIPERQWRENLALVAEWLAGFDGRALAEPPRIDWKAPANFEPDTSLGDGDEGRSADGGTETVVTSGGVLEAANETGASAPRTTHPRERRATLADERRDGRAQFSAAHAGTKQETPAHDSTAHDSTAHNPDQPNANASGDAATADAATGDAARDARASGETASEGTLPTADVGSPSATETAPPPTGADNDGTATSPAGETASGSASGSQATVRIR